MSQARSYQNARCCGKTFQRWTIVGRPFPPTHEACYICGAPLRWAASEKQFKRTGARDTVDQSVPTNGLEKTARVDLGVDLLYSRCRFGIPVTYVEIAAWAGCSDGNIFMIEKRALRKLRKALDRRGLLKNDLLAML